MRNLILVGSNHNLAQIIDAAQGMGYAISGILDDDYFGNRKAIAGVEIIGSEKQHEFDREHDYFVAINWVADRSIIQQRNQIRRRALIEQLKNFELTNIIHPRAKVAGSAIMGKGIFVAADAHIGHGCRIGHGAQIREQSYVAHDAVIGVGSVLQVQGYVGARVEVGSHSYLGIGARLVPSGKLRIPSNSFIKSHTLITESNLKMVHPIQWYQES